MNANEYLIIINKNTNSPSLVKVMLKWIKQNRPISHIKRLYHAFSRDPSGLQVVHSPAPAIPPEIADLLEQRRLNK